MQSVATFAALLAVAVLLVPVFKRAGLGTVLGYLAAGVLIGPSGFGVVTDGENLLHTAELGVVLLLFIIGLELQPSRLWALRKPVFGLGSLQFFGVGALLIGGAYLLGFDWPIAIMIGLTLALSSTAFVLPTLAERHEMHSRYGRETFAILLFQDLMVIPLLALLPLLGAARSDGDVSPLVGLGFLAVVVLIGRPVLDAIFRHVTRINSREMFTAAALATALGLALLLQLGGLSMSLGAFVAGVLLSDSDFRHELEAAIAPFQGLLMGFFFIAVGMTINLGMIVEHPLNVLGLTVALVLVKGGGMYGLRRLARGSRQVSRMQALALAQCGEFAFVLFGVAQANQLLAPEVVAQLNLSVALSMATAPLLFILADRLNAREAAAEPVAEPEADTLPDLPNPVVMAGFGRVGQIIGRVLLARNVPFTALDIDHEEVQTIKRFGIQAYYGNAAHLDVLHAARVDEAKVFVLAIDDIETSLRCAELVRKHFPHVTVVARARNRFHAYRLMDLGVELMMRETFRSSLEMARMIFEALGKAPDKSQQIIDRFAAHDMDLLKREQALYHDEHQLIQSAREASEELVLILEQELGDARPDAAAEPADPPPAPATGA
ncbi:monovalent cation:proton antiporter-2 (CPA2) family protein [Denitromonas sp.]|uniref:monovalent cation:proton antiporter-2 (CPA2) family protein n=1 Tax=Denitromonas sp. TaxID=2734609 RepID=UPI002AFEF1D2|nr:monovalent cation:proton antiporter-2 (CPA2) family protein [Denitromonas sp.]